jgi:signal transduction histidine kinase
VLTLGGMVARDIGERLDRGLDAGDLGARFLAAIPEGQGISLAYLPGGAPPQGRASARGQAFLSCLATAGPTLAFPVLSLDHGVTLALFEIPGKRGHLLIGSETSFPEPPSSEEMAYTFLQAGGASLAVILIVAVFLGLIVFRAITARLNRLGTCLSRVAEGDLTCRMSDPGHDEIGMLGTCFNRMASRLQEVVSELEGVDERRRQFLADVSHELRTPLTSIRVNLNDLSQISCDFGQPTVPLEEREELALSLEEVEHMSCLVDDLLELARMESPQFHLAREDSVLQCIVSDCIGRLKNSLQNRHIQVVTRFSPDPVRRQVDPRRFGQVVTNLLTNAIRSVDQHGVIEVTVEERDGRALVQIADDGPGIPGDQLPELFERFASRSQGGTGLGLSIVRRLVEAHEGQIQLKSRPERGVIASVEL